MLIKRTSKHDGSILTIPLQSALDELSGYYKDIKLVEQGLIAGRVFQTNWAYFEREVNHANSQENPDR